MIDIKAARKDLYKALHQLAQIAEAPKEAVTLEEKELDAYVELMLDCYFEGDRERMLKNLTYHFHYAYSQRFTEEQAKAALLPILIEHETPRLVLAAKRDLLTIAHALALKPAPTEADIQAPTSAFDKHIARYFNATSAHYKDAAAQVIGCIIAAPDMPLEQGAALAQAFLQRQEALLPKL